MNEHEHQKAALRQKEEADKKALLDALILISCSPLHQTEALVKEQIESDPSNSILARLHQERTLLTYTQDLKKLKESIDTAFRIHTDAIRPDEYKLLGIKQVYHSVLNAVLRAAEATPSSAVAYPTSNSQSAVKSCGLFSSKHVVTGVAVTAGVCVVGGIAASATILGLAFTSVTTSTAVMASVATAAAAGTAFPPLGIALIVAAAAAIVIAAIVLAAWAMRQKRQAEVGQAAFYMFAKHGLAMR